MNLKPHKDYPDNWELISVEGNVRKFLVPIRENTSPPPNTEVWDADEWLNFDSGIE